MLPIRNLYRLPPDIRDIPRYAAVKRAEDRESGVKACYFVRGRKRPKSEVYCHEEHNEILTGRQ